MVIYSCGVGNPLMVVPGNELYFGANPQVQTVRCRELKQENLSLPGRRLAGDVFWTPPPASGGRMTERPWQQLFTGTEQSTQAAQDLGLQGSGGWESGMVRLGRI